MKLKRRIDYLSLSGPGLTDEMRKLLAEPVRTDEGFLIVEGWGSRTGVQIYSDGAGGVVREYRPPTEVHDAASLATFEGRPFVDDHPAGFVTPSTASSLSKGTILSVTAHEDLGWNRVRVAIHDAATIKAVDSGKRQLSLGYYARVDLEEGTSPTGERYDAVQRGIRINHIALVDRARAGDQAQLRLDASGDVLPGTTHTPTGGKRPMEEIEITLPSGAQMTVKKDNAPALLSLFAQQAAEAAQIKADGDKLRGELDTLKETMARRDAVDIDALVQQRSDLLTEAKPLLPAGYVAAGRSDHEVRLDALINAHPKDTARAARLKGESQDYVSGAYGLLVESAAAGKRHVDSLGSAVDTAGRVAPAATPGADLTPMQKRLAEAQKKADAARKWNPLTGRSGVSLTDAGGQ